MTEKLTHQGGCHCGAVRFEVRLNTSLKAVRCNCSMCMRLDFLHLIVDEADFKLLQGGELLSEYQFNSGTARHWFCRNCGIKSFYRPRSHPDGYSVNARCLDDVPIKSLVFDDFDGQNWDQAITTKTSW